MVLLFPIILTYNCHIKRKKSEEFMKKVYVSEIVGPRRRGRPIVKEAKSEYREKEVYKSVLL